MSQVSVVLTKGSEYEHNGITFYVNTPALVTADDAKRLTETGRFRVVTGAHNLLHTAATLQGVIASSATPPKNTLGVDNLNGKRVLLKRAGAFGDCIFVAQLAAYLKSVYPNAYVALVVHPRWVAAIQAFDHIDSVHTIHEASLYEFVYSFDYIIDFSDVIEAPDALKKDYYASHFTRAGLPVGDLARGIPACKLNGGDAAAHARIALTRDLMRKHGLAAGEYVVVLRGTSNVLKTWDDFTYRALIDALLAMPSTERTFTHVVAIGTRGDKHTYQLATSEYVELPEYPIEVMAELVSRSACVIGGDTGFTHFAVACGLPSVSYWCATSPTHTLPHAPNKQNTIAVTANMACHPCDSLRSSFCPHFDGNMPACVHKVSVRDMIDGVRRLTGVRPADALHTFGTSNTSLLNTDEARRVYDSDLVNIAFLMDDCDRYTGGGFYMWSMIQVFAKRTEALIFVLSKTKKFVYKESDVLPANVVLVYDPTRELLFGTRSLRFPLVVGHPHASGADAITYAQQTHGVKSILTIYETPNYIEKYRQGRDTTEEFWAQYKAALLAADVVVTISQEVKRHLAEWLLKSVPLGQTLQKPIETFYPVINDDVADTVLDPVFAKRGSRDVKRNTVVMLGRNVKYKGWKEALELFVTRFALSYFSPSKPCDVYIIGDSASALNTAQVEVWRTYGINIIFEENTNEKRKWELLREAKLMIHASDFEGFGITVAEGMYAAVPVLCKPLPVFREVYGVIPYFYTTPETFIDSVKAIFTAWDLPGDDAGRSYELLHESVTEGAHYVHRRYTRSVRKTKTLPTFISRNFNTVFEAANAGLRARVTSGEALRVAMVTPYHNRCGISETTRELLKHFRCTNKVFAPQEIVPAESLIREDVGNIERCWQRQFTSSGALVDAVTAFGATVVHVQHEFSVYRNTQEFLRFLERIKRRGHKIVVTLHTVPTSRTAFVEAVEQLADAVVTTKPSTVVQSTVIPLAVETRQINETVEESRTRIPGLAPDAYVVGTFGLFQPHKGTRAFLKTYHDVAAALPGKRVVFLLSGYSRGHKDTY
jgi:glycosyltransferase involved in cell wall biosynthesis/ADP-heptose:LPS heptosyltransferase